MKKHMLIMLACVGVLFGSIFIYKGIQHYFIKQFLASQKSPIVTVSATEAKYSDWKPQLKSTGSARTVKGVNVTSELAGMIRTIFFTPGTYVKKDELLVQLDIDSDVAQLKSLEAQAKYAAITYKRNKSQYKIGAVSKEQLDADESNYHSTAQQVNKQRADIAKKTIRAPFSGKLGISAVYPGQFINPGDKIVNLQTLSPIFVDFNVPQEAISQLSVGQAVSIRVDTYADTEFKGTITTINPEVDANTRNIEVEATIPNEEHKLLPGMFTSVIVTTGKPQQHLTLPQTAIAFNSYGDVAYILQDTHKEKNEHKIWKAIQKFVTVDNVRGEQVSISHGINENDMVVTSGQLKIKNGSLVTINNSVTPSDNPDPQPSDE